MARQTLPHSRNCNSTRNGECLIPESISEKQQDDDDDPLTPRDARICKTCVGKAMYLSHHRPDIQHSVNTLSRSLRNPTMTAMRRIKKLTRYVLGTSDLYQELIPHQQTEVLQIPSDTYWADCKETCQRCSGGAVFFHGCAVLTWARTQKTRALSSAEKRAVCHRLSSNRRPWSSTTVARMPVQNSTTALDRFTKCACSVQTKRTWQNETCRAEDAHSAGVTKNGTTASSQSVDSRQPGRSHDMSQQKRIKFRRILNLRGSLFTDLSQRPVQQQRPAQ